METLHNASMLLALRDNIVIQQYRERLNREMWKNARFPSILQAFRGAILHNYYRIYGTAYI